MRTTYITAAAIGLLIGLWLLSGQINRPEPEAPKTLAQQNRERQAQQEDLSPTQVRARVSQAEPQVRAVRVRGRTENKRTVEVKAETTGRIVARPVERGDRVEAGDLLCKISLEDREAGFREARAALQQAQIEYQGSLELKAKGFQSETAIAQSKARLATAEASLERRELDLARTRIKAPFAGFIEDVSLQIGDYVGPGSTCATVIDLDPMLLVGRVPEKEVQNVRTGINARGILSSGQTVSGPVRFVGAQSDPDTRTYPIEVEIDNADGAIKSGITTEILLPIETVPAHRVSPALFALDDDGGVGIRIVNAEDRVEFHRIDVLISDASGAWITGLPDIATIITVGQELVVPGERVDVTYEARQGMPVALPLSDGDPAVSSGENNTPQSANQTQPMNAPAIAGTAISNR